MIAGISLSFLILCSLTVGMDLLFKGLRAERKLLRGAKTLSVVGPVREFSKPGGLMQALTDFSRVSRTEVEEFTTTIGVNTFSKNIKDSMTICTDWYHQ